MEKILVPHDLALRLSHWHSSMYDPIYAVSSCGLAKEEVEKDTFTLALTSLVHDSQKPEFSNHKNELQEIICQMRSCLETFHEDFAECVGRAMARCFFAMAWADEAEQREDSDSPGMGVDIIEAAPQTPESALEEARSHILTLESMHQKSLREIYQDFCEKLSPYDFGHELALSITGNDNRLRRLKTQYQTYDFYDFCDTWKNEDDY